MYGFIEKALADHIGIDYTEYPFTDGSCAALISKEDFERISIAVEKVYEKQDVTRHSYTIPSPRRIGSDISGMQVLVTTLWKNINVLSNVTDGETKLKQWMLTIYNINRANTLQEINNYFDLIKNELNITSNNNITDNTEEVDDEEKEEKEEERKYSESELIIRDIASHFNNGGFSNEYEVIIKSLNDNLNLYVIDLCVNDKVFNNTTIYYELAESINKNIIILDNDLRCSRMEIFLKKIDMKEFQENFLIIYANPSASSFLFRSSSSLRPLCYNMKVNNYYSVELLQSSKSNSFYDRFDRIMIDTKTNVTWAYRDRCFIYFTFNVSSNLPLAELCIKSLKEWLKKEIDIKKIKEQDEEMYECSIKMNKEKFIKKNIDSSSKYIDDLKIKARDLKTNYDHHLREVMRYGRLTNDINNQISFFDEKKFAMDKSREASIGFEETLNIPKVSNIIVEDDYIEVLTENIYAKDDRSGKWHDIGKFVIRINTCSDTYSSANSVIIINTKHLVDGLNERMNAPHVFPNGNMCHGNLISGMVEAYKNRDVFQLVYQLILFLQSVNVDDAAGRHIDKWPEVSEEVAMGIVGEEELENDERDEDEVEFDEKLSESIPV